MCFAQNADPQPIQRPASIADQNVQAARTDSNRRAKAAAGSQSTILSSLMAPVLNAGQKQLMGQ